jgi:DNA-binding NarL/FixJ family response regulator
MAKFLGSVPELQLVASTDADAEVLGLVRAHKPHVAVLDLNMEWPNLCELVSGLSTQNVLPVLMNDRVDDTQTIELLRRGICGIVPRRATPEMLRKCVNAIGAGEYWITRRVVGRILDQVRITPTSMLRAAVPGQADLRVKTSDVSNSPDSGANRYNLTRREMQMVAALAEGMTNRDIASDFGISESTVKHHLTSIFDKVGVSSRLELATFASYHGLVTVGSAEEAQPVGA